MRILRILCTVYHHHIEEEEGGRRLGVRRMEMVLDERGYRYVELTEE
jgi:hypothetical protein